MNPSLKKALIDSLSEIEVDDIMEVEFCEDHVECCQISRERLAFEAAVQKLADLWRPIVKDKGLHIRHGRAGIRFIDCNRLGIYFSMEDAKRASVAPNMHQHILAQEKAPIAGRLSQKIAPKNANKIVPLSAMLILPFLALAWVDPIWDVATTEGISCGMATDGTVIINGAETATGYVKIPEYVYVPFYGNGPVGHIGNNAFFRDGKLKGIEIPNCVSSIGNTAFYQCGSLETVIFPSGYAAIVFDSNLNSWISTDYLWRKESDGVTSLGKNLFVGCSKIKDITISQCICSSRLSTIFPDAFETIENVIITPGTTVIGDYTFRGCRSLKKIFIPRVLTPSRYSTITKIGDFAFDGCASLADIVLPDSITDIGVDVFKNCTGLKSVTLSASLNDIPVCTFYGCTNLANVAIPNGVIEIHDGAFYGCALATVTLPGSVTDVASGAFGGCSELRSIVASSDNPKYSSDHGLLLTKDGRTLVAGVNGDVVIPDGVTRIGGNAFFNLQKLMSVTIPASVTHIESSAFRGCSGLTNIVFKGDAPSVGGSVFLGVSQDCRVVIDRSSNGWGGLVPCPWNGLLITYPWYNITLYSEGGQCAEHSRIVDHGSVIGDLPEPTKVGFSFDGWYSESHGGDKIYSSDLVLSDLDVYAQWLPNKYSVSFDANGGVGGVTNELDYASRIVVPDVTREGYTLAGWSPEIDETVPASNAIYTAKWQINQYTVTFDANGGDGGMSVLQDYGADIVVPEVCKTECVFNGWLPIVDDTVPASNVTYTAQWRVNQYAVVFDADGGVGGITNTQEYASKIVPPNVSREGYTFVGWSPEVDATMPASNVTYTVLWRINEYAIAFDANGGIGSVTNEQDYATEIVTPDVSREGFTFMGWSPEVDATVPASNVTYMAQWKLNEYTVSLFVCDGEDGSPLVVEYGAKVSDIALPTRDGYVFGGWYDKPEDGKLVDGDTLIVGDMSLYAKWNSIYTVVFDANGGEGVMPDQPFVYGKELSLSNVVFTAEDRRFTGWALAKDGDAAYVDGAVVSNLTEVAGGTVTLYAVWAIWTADMQTLDDALGGVGVVSLDGNDNIVVTLTNDVSGTVEIPDNVGAVIIDLNGHDMVGGGSLGETALPGPAILIVAGEGEGNTTRLAIVDMSEGEKGQILGGGESAGVEVSEDAATGVKLDVEEGVGVFNGDGSEQELKPKLVGAGKVTTPKTWKTGQKVTWKATADKGSVFARWEGPLVDSLNLTKNERRNPSLAFAVPEGFETNMVTAVFIPIDDDGLYSLGITQTEFDLKETVSGVCVTDDSQSYVTATASGLPTGLKFDAKKMAITGTPTKSGVYWVQIKAKNASGYQWAENVRVTVPGGGTEAKEPKLTRTAHHPLTVICANEGGTVSGTGVYAEGKKVSVKATPAKGYVFAGWHETANSEKGTVNGVDGADYRSASLNVTVPETRYVFALFATKEDDADSLKVAVEDVTTEKDGTIALDLGACVASLSLPKLAVSGLPSGVKYDAKTLKLTGKATKPGVYTVTVKATNASVTRATDATTATFKITVPNFECEALPGLKSETDAYGTIHAGVKFGPGLIDCTPEDGWTVKAAGLPAGLKFAAKETKDATYGVVPAWTIYGVPTAKAGAYTVTFTASKKGEKNQVATITLNVEALPAWAVGNFEGFVRYDENDDGFATMSITAAGKVSGKIAYGGTNWTFKADSYDITSETVGSTNFIVETVAVSGKATRNLWMTITDIGHDYLPDSTVAFVNGNFGDMLTEMYRLPWKDKNDTDAASLIASYAGAYSCRVPYGADSDDVTFVLDEKGVVKGVVILPDGAKTRKATFSCNVLPNYDSLSVVIALPQDAKKGYPAVFKVVNLVNHSGEGADNLAFRDPGVVAAVSELTAESGATGTVSVNPKYGQVAPGKDVTLTAKAAKGSVFHCWEITGVDTEGIDLSSSTLKIKMTDTGDVFAKAVFVTAEEDAASIALSVDALGGEITPEAIISVTNTCGVALKWSVAADALSKPVVAVTGLPAGLKFTAKDIMKKGSKTEVEIPANTIYGAPTAESKLDAKTGLRKPSVVKFTVTTAGKSKRVYPVEMTVLPLPDWAVGTFNGGGDYGQVSLTVAKTGKLSGKYLSEGLTWTLAADSFDSIDESGDVYRATLIGKSGKLVMTNEIGVAGNAIGGYAESVDYIAYQNNWKLEPWKTVGKPFAKAAALEYEDSASVAGVKAPGVLSLKFAASGAVTVKGSFVTGVNERTGKDILYTASGSAVLAPQSEPDEIGAFDAVVFVYLPPKAGKFDGYVRCIDVRWTGDGWIKQ